MRSPNDCDGGPDFAEGEELCLTDDNPATAPPAPVWPPEAGSGVQLLWNAGPTMPAVEGDDLAQALVKAGWIPTYWDDQTCRLERGGSRISLPRTRMEPDAVALIGHRCGLNPMQLLSCLERVFSETLLALASRAR